ncbi:DNA polymerase III subunit chi [Variovorax sp. KK3]|uniref:DNA polymerase III subunit chi n=1 Tax=Variovorax sp. KK3 TaxID=1855728 RepID=UPI00097C601C|nr:DNA polymerase III subunit chi [Variovorax sp. KK3]
MTGIDFHFNTPDKIGYACRLLRKAVGARGARVVVVADAETLEAVDQALWTFAPTEFIAHCRGDGEPGQLSRSPVVLSERGDAVLPHRQVLVNLGIEVPAGFERFERLIDVVSSDDADRQFGRRRWRHYADRGYAIQRHDFAGSGA